MQRISITNPQNIIDGTTKKYYFKLRNTGGPKGDKGDKGDTGATGPQGPKGDAATVAVGSTTTLAVGQDATVENVGSIYNAVLDFGIPQGPQGPQGAKGDKGDTGAKGDTGPRGPQGEKGTNATVYIGTTTTGEPGTQASVYNSGTESNAVLNFTIPRGDVGPSVPLVQETGNSTTKAMSQNATTEALNGKQNTLTAGSNITISGNTISAKDTTYTAGDNVQINGTVISATDTTYTAGANIQIKNGTISATDTTYTAGNGLNLNGTEFSADTTVLATKEDLEGYYTKPQTDNLLAPKLEVEVVAELPTTGAEGKLYLTPKNYTRGTGTGNPIEATVTEQAGALESFQLDGDTFQQTYEGKNILDYITGLIPSGRGLTNTINNDGTITTVGKPNDDYTRIIKYYDLTPYLEDGATYTLSSTLYDNKTFAQVRQASVIDSSAYNYDTIRGTKTFTVDKSQYTYRMGIMTGTMAAWGDDPPAITKGYQLEKSASATSFEPYVGGTPSPNPSYPQQIQTVTGTQTISINGTNYPLDLGDIQLCGLGDDGNGNPLYKDRIYRDGDDWKVHKGISSITLDGTEGWAYADNYKYARCPSYIFVDKPLGGTGLGLQLSNYFGVITDWGTFRDSTSRNAFFPLLDEGYKISIRNTNCTSVDDYKSWLATNKPSFYYPVETPTDTTITDQTLIAQLEAIRTASLENGTNTITNSATAPNLAGDMEVGYYGYNPTNRYDKWLWLDLNNNYEQIGGE